MPWNQVSAKFKTGTLKSGSGKKVTSQKQMVAIMLSEKREARKNAEYRHSLTQPKRKR